SWLEYRPVTPGVAGSSPVHSATYTKTQYECAGFFAVWGKVNCPTGNESRWSASPAAPPLFKNPVRMCWVFCYLGYSDLPYGQRVPLERQPGRSATIKETQYDCAGFFAICHLLIQSSIYDMLPLRSAIAKRDGISKVKSIPARLRI
ncbi:hypothetical protein, partial [Vibrio sp. qd031]|uniref:hypothetical protein n=1 Tax=Vibrio sp. qd031 TaxID=1603038 RepID=UPI001A8F7CB1